MTIAAGFCCSDGVVICADRELTYPEAVRLDAFKVRTFSSVNLEGAVTGAGDWAYLLMALQTIQKEMGSAQNFEEVEGRFQGIVLDIYERNIALYPDHPKPTFDLLLGVRWCDGRRILLQSNATAFTASNKFEVLGVGMELGRHLADILYSPSMSSQQVCLLAAYILRLAKKYVQFVGGHSDIYSLTGDEEDARSRDWNLAWLEHDFADIDNLFGPVLLAMTDPARRDFKGTLRHFCEEAERLQERIVALLVDAWEEKREKDIEGGIL